MLEKNKFSPPYGDGMLFDNTRKATTSFSPPYGDGATSSK